MSTGQFFRNFTLERDTFPWWVYLRSTATGRSILLRGVWKFAMACICDVEAMGFHVVEHNGDEWAIAPLYETDFRRLRPDHDDVIGENLRWW